jgi:hypothetical protein
MTGGEHRGPDFDTSTAHPARVYDYWLGGHFLYTHYSEGSASSSGQALSPRVRLR